MTSEIRAFLALLLFASLASAQTLPWHKIGSVQNSTGSYTPVVQLCACDVQIFANTPDNNNDPATSGGYWLRAGTWAKVSTPPLNVKPPDMPAQDSWIRTSGVARGLLSGAYYAVWYTGDGYPTQGGYSPSWAESYDNGHSWTWMGPISLFGRNQSSAANLIVDEIRNDAYACMYWMDLPPDKLVLVHAPMPCMPGDWQSDGLNTWSIAGEEPQFVTAVKTPFAYHRIGAAYFDGTNHRPLRHDVSCDGITNWRVVEMASPIGQSGAKGANLSYSPSDNTLHALVSGVHWTLPESNWGC